MFKVTSGLITPRGQHSWARHRFLENLSQPIDLSLLSILKPCKKIFACEKGKWDAMFLLATCGLINYEVHRGSVCPAPKYKPKPNLS